MQRAIANLRRRGERVLIHGNTQQIQRILAKKAVDCSGNMERDVRKAEGRRQENERGEEFEEFCRRREQGRERAGRPERKKGNNRSICRG